MNGAPPPLPNGSMPIMESLHVSSHVEASADNFTKAYKLFQIFEDV